MGWSWGSGLSLAKIKICPEFGNIRVSAISFNVWTSDRSQALLARFIHVEVEVLSSILRYSISNLLGWLVGLSIAKCRKVEQALSTSVSWNKSKIYLDPLGVEKYKINS